MNSIEDSPEVPHEPSAAEIQDEQSEQDLTLIALSRYHNHLATGQVTVSLEEVMDRFGLTESDLINPDEPLDGENS